VASFTVTKLRWLLEHEPENAARTETVCLPHDWITWQLGGARRDRTLGDGALATDRSEASGTGYFSPVSGTYRLDLLTQSLWAHAATSGLLQPSASAGDTPTGQLLGAGQEITRQLH